MRTAPFAATGTDGLADAAVEALGPRPAVLLARHGVVGVGRLAGRGTRRLHRWRSASAQMAWLLRSRVAPPPGR